MTQVNFLGIPVEGTITPGARVPQLPLSELQPLLLDLLRDDQIEEFGWRQYTPYFNDGELCVFGVWGFWVRTVADAGAPIDDLRITGYYVDVHRTLGRAGSDRDLDGGRPYEGNDEERFWRARALLDAFDSGAFGDVLLEAFGDHATVTVRRTGIAVEFYRHE